jgi:hypothetical protein
VQTVTALRLLLGGTNGLRAPGLRTHVALAEEAPATQHRANSVSATHRHRTPHTLNGFVPSDGSGAGFFHLYELRVLAPNADPDRDTVSVVGGAEVLGRWTLANACECTYDADEGVWVLHLPLPATCLSNPDELTYKVRLGKPMTHYTFGMHYYAESAMCAAALLEGPYVRKQPLQQGLVQLPFWSVVGDSKSR